MRWTILSLILVAMVLVPFFLFEDQFNALAAELARGDGPRWLAGGGIFALLALDVFLPVPSSIVSTAAGVLLGLAGGAAVVFAGMMTACLIGYYIGARGSGLARRLVGDQGLARAAELARRYGDWALVGCRPVPVLAEASVVFAGLVRTPVGRFVGLTAASNLGIAIGYAAIGAFSMRVESFLLAFLGAMMVPAIAMGIAKIFFSRHST
jgi:membrane protein DedA with SNARE-associated domain